ncbi:hypothetical protein VHEMI00478 [[Torrubiella] hemipterigena]|uniref:BIG2 domain-containing protein n=1 Tax=[Torrubiella] hemipterigena TaxID=1531966 RepID=A0A0A1T4M7_9HYPO|nr:hypothetical protein VHEMI00478 [[Torrubiella] hemipterigena]
MKFWSTVAYTVAGLVGLAAANDSLTVDATKASMTFQYSTSAQDSTNWVAIYEGGKTPTNESTKYLYSAWAWAPSRSGSAYINGNSVPEGNYYAWLLAENGYTVLAGPAKVHASPVYSSTVTYRPDKKALTFDYKTNVPDNSNWIALYVHGTTKPGTENYYGYKYAPGSSGSVTIPADSLLPGDYDVFFLGKNGYTPIAAKLQITYQGDTGPVSFRIDKFTTKNAREGDEFEASIRGLIKPRAETPAFKIIGETNGDWVSVDNEGTLSGISTCSSGTSVVTVQATAKDGSTANLEVSIPCVAQG